MNKIRTSTDQRNYTMIYHDFLESNLLNGQEKLVFIFLKRFSDSEGKCFPSLNKLAQISGYSKSTIQRTLKSLEEKRVLSIEHRRTKEKGDTSNIYILYDRAETWQKKELSAPATDAQESQPLKTDNKTIEKESQEENQEEKLQCADSNSENIEKKRVEQTEADGGDSTLKVYEELIKKNIEYENLCNAHQHDKAFINELISNILDVVMSHSKTIKIQNEYKNAELVKSVLLKLNYYQIEYVIQKYHQITTKITNKRQYILTMLYNAHLESESDVINEVAHDLSVLPNRDIRDIRDRKKDIEYLENAEGLSYVKKKYRFEWKKDIGDRRGRLYRR